MTADIIIPVMRRASLGATVSHYLGLAKSLCRRIYIADFDPSFTHNQLGNLIADPRVEHVGVVGQQYFNKAAAINLAFYRTTKKHLIICDSDVTLPSDVVRQWLRMLEIRDDLVIHLETVHETDDGRIRPGFGIVAIARNNFMRMEGYCSYFRGWGFEDRDFLARAAAAGLHVRPNGTAPHQSHNEASRTANYEEKILAQSRERNLRLFEERQRAMQLHGTLASDVSELQCRP